MSIQARQKKLFRANFCNLAGKTRFPYALLISQSETERTLEERLNGMGVTVHRPYKLVGMTKLPDGIKVTFESGEEIQARYVVGADGARSMVRGAWDS